MKEKTSVNAKRRKPAQSRARATAEAIQQAFIQLLVEQGYDQTSIRQVTSLAGVGIGSFYEYFSSKEALAAVCIHLRVKAVAATMRACIDAHRDAPLPERIDALIDAQIQAPLAESEHWAALFLVERRISEADAFRKPYAEFVQLWVDMLDAGPGLPAQRRDTGTAFTIHSMIYGLVSQALITRIPGIDPARLRTTIRTAVHGYVSVIAPLAYRLFEFERMPGLNLPQ
ncbi:TetR/AcrR family transcriptional regulator [Paraburkholderia oxyphila]|uniref:TetR/AcrR family transcriptional regulator n=1 Tax=Paraburkholderia oxyphila TaxID=614212 RepID=UPI0005B8FD60|nr:TetR/AcrR family transcriptional regulator [Paraburkholderia oxyphila]